jgi:hypothetical protein
MSEAQEHIAIVGQQITWMQSGKPTPVVDTIGQKTESSVDDCVQPV